MVQPIKDEQGGDMVLWLQAIIFAVFPAIMAWAISGVLMAGQHPGDFTPGWLIMAPAFWLGITFVLRLCLFLAERRFDRRKEDE